MPPQLSTHHLTVKGRVDLWDTYRTNVYYHEDHRQKNVQVSKRNEQTLTLLLQLDILQGVLFRHRLKTILQSYDQRYKNSKQSLSFNDIVRQTVCQQYKIIYTLSKTM
jgi:hypothetical protein